MTDDRIVDYLRSRGRSEPPPDLVRTVMAAVGEAPEPRSRFAGIVPIAAVAGVLATLAVFAMLVIQDPNVGPGPSPTATAWPTPPATEAVPAAPTVDDLREALAAAVDVLRAAPGVEGRQIAELDDVIGSATWFDWRPNGDSVIVLRQDLDVTQSGWWVTPGGSPPASGQRVQTGIWMLVGDEFFFGDDVEWHVGDREDAPPAIAYGPGILDGVIEPWQPLEGLIPRLPDPEAAHVTRRDLAGGGVEWLLETAWRDGTAIQRWTIGAAGELRSWTWSLEEVSVDVEGGFNANADFASLIFTMVEGDEIERPEVDARPDTAAAGAPPDLPLRPAPTSIGGVEQVEACEHPSGRYRVTLPEGWWTTRDGDDDQASLWEACELFGPEPFDVRPVADSTWPVGVAVSIGWIDGGCIGSFLELLSSDEAIVDGQTAWVQEYARGTSINDPPGLYQYVIDLTEPGVDCEVGGRFIMASTSVEMAGDYEDNKAFLDQIMQSMVISPP